MTDDIKQGDTVDVNFRGKVRYHDLHRGEWVISIIPDGDDPTFTVYGLKEKWVTKVEPPVQAGDEVTSEQAKRLPVGSTVLYEPGGGVSIKVNDTQWISVSPDGSDATPYEPRWKTSVRLKVLHVGGS